MIGVLQIRRALLNTHRAKADMSKPLSVGATIGIIGGGQLGRMLAMAAAKLGFHIIVLEPQENCPASQVANEQIVAQYDDEPALAQLAERTDVITYEFENIAVEALKKLADDTAIFPPSDALRISQDRLVEKDFLNKSGLQTAPFFDISTVEDLQNALTQSDGRGILKTRRFGYDGKGQIRFAGTKNDPSIGEAIADLNGAPAILECFIDFECEISVIATRDQFGTVECFEPAQNVHKNGILFSSTVPSSVDEGTKIAAVLAATDLISALNYVGTLGLEFFVMKDGGLIANEFAPRVHNSGHWTEAACAVSQFEQHIRAIAGWPLTAQHRHSDCEMENLLGDDINKLSSLATEPNVVLHSYGKAEARDGRKMGHFTRIFPKNSH